MAVTSVEEELCLGGSEDREGNRTATVRYIVVTDSIADGQKTVLENDDLPQRNDFYQFQDEQDNELFLESKECTLKSNEDSRRVWLVTCRFSSKPSSGDSDKNENSGNPLDMTPKISIYSQKERKPILRDLDGQLIASSAGEPYDPVQEIDNTRYYIRIIRNVLTCDPVFNSKFKDAVNSAAWGGFPVGAVKVERPGDVEVLYTGEGQRYYQETWEFAVADWDEENEEYVGWQLKLLDYGMYRIDGTDRYVLKDSNGDTLTSAALLDGAGDVLAVGDDPVELPSFRVYNAKFFQDLNLPETI